MNKFFAGILIIILAGNLASCGLLKHHKKTNKSATDTTAVRTDTNAVKAIIDTTGGKTAADSTLLNKAKTDSTATVIISPEKKLLIDTIQPLWEQPYDFSTFDGKAKMSYGNRDFTAYIKIKKDSAIWINVTATVLITVQVARIYITPDTFKMVNNLEKEVTIMSLSEAAKLLPTPMDFSALQNFVLGQPLRRSGVITDAKDSVNVWSIEVTDNTYKQLVHYSKADSTMQGINMNTINPNGPKAVIKYMNYAPVDGRKFSKNRNMNIDNASKHYSIEMNYVSQTFDKPVEMPFSIPSNYSVNK